MNHHISLELWLRWINSSHHKQSQAFAFTCLVKVLKGNYDVVTGRQTGGTCGQSSDRKEEGLRTAEGKNTPFLPSRVIWRLQIVQNWNTHTHISLVQFIFQDRKYTHIKILVSFWINKSLFRMKLYKSLVSCVCVCVCVQAL